VSVHKATKADILVQSETAITTNRAAEAFPWLAENLRDKAVTLLNQAREDWKAGENSTYRAQSACSGRRSPTPAARPPRGRRGQPSGCRAAPSRPSPGRGAARSTAPASPVKHQQIRHRSLDSRQRGTAVGGHRNPVTLGGERPLEHPPDRRIIIDDEDREH
jgi:hypothetical protein